MLNLSDYKFHGNIEHIYAVVTVGIIMYGFK